MKKSKSRVSFNKKDQIYRYKSVKTICLKRKKNITKNKIIRWIERYMRKIFLLERDEYLEICRRFKTDDRSREACINHICVAKEFLNETVNNFIRDYRVVFKIIR